MTQSNLKGVWKGEICPLLRQFPLSRVLCLRGQKPLAKPPLLQEKKRPMFKSKLKPLLNWTGSVCPFLIKKAWKPNVPGTPSSGPGKRHKHNECFFNPTAFPKAHHKLIRLFCAEGLRDGESCCKEWVAQIGSTQAFSLLTAVD